MSQSNSESIAPKSETLLVTVENPGKEESDVNKEDESKKEKLRWGKWTREEEAYTTRLIADFTAGLLTDVTNGTTMRSWLSTKLRCCPMRISKKFVGEQSIGKRMFERNDTRINEMSEEEKQRRHAEVEKLHEEFCESWIREEKERLENKANGSRKRKRNKKKDANGLAISSAKKQQLGHGFKMSCPMNPAMKPISSSNLITSNLSLLQRPPMIKTTCPSFNMLSTSKAAALNQKKPFKTESKLPQASKFLSKPTKQPFNATTPRAPVKRVNSVPQMTKPTQAPSLTPTKKSTAHASSVSSQLQELQAQLVNRSKSLSFDQDDVHSQDNDCEELIEYNLDLASRDFRELDFMNDGDCWIPEALCEVPIPSYDTFYFNESSSTQSSLHTPLKEDDLDAALSPTSVMDLYPNDSLWSTMDIPSSDVLLYDYLF